MLKTTSITGSRSSVRTHESKSADAHGPHRSHILIALIAGVCLGIAHPSQAAQGTPVVDQNAADESFISGEIRNKPEHLERFRDQALGMFIHWSVDSQLGSVISHSLVGADGDYARRFFEELPTSFNPTQYDPVEWASLAKITNPGPH